MAKSKIYLNFTVKRYSDRRLNALAEKVSHSLSISPGFESLRGLAQDIKLKNEAFETLLMGMKEGTPEKTALKNQARSHLEDLLRIAALQVLTEYSNDDLMLLKSGFELTRPKVPVGILPQVQRLQIVQGPISGSLHIRWQRIPQARMYELRFEAISDTEKTTPQYRIVSCRQILLEGLLPGKRYRISIAAAGTHPTRVWSPEILSPYVS